VGIHDLKSNDSRRRQEKAFSNNSNNKKQRLEITVGSYSGENSISIPDTPLTAHTVSSCSSRGSHRGRGGRNGAVGAGGGRSGIDESWFGPYFSSWRIKVPDRKDDSPGKYYGSDCSHQSHTPHQSCKSY
jgi:hypothetical protein